MTQHDPVVSLHHMLDFALRARRIGAGIPADVIEGDELLSMALPHALELIGEAASRVPDDIRAVLKDIPWRQAIDMRNRLAHGYDSVDFGRVAETIEHDLPPLIAALEEALRRYDQT